MPYFSIILPVYNVEKYLDKCISSILSQKFTDYELILVDDGSQDNSGKICDNYGEINKNIIVVHKQNGGVSSARNTGIKQSHGKWCVFIDPDDYINDDNFLDNLYNESFKKDILIYGCTIFDDETNKIIKRKYTKINNINKFDNNVEKIHYLNLTNNLSASSWTHATRRSYIIKNNLYFNENLKVCEDIEWFFRMMIKEPQIRTLSDYSYFYRKRKNSLSNTKKENFWKGRYNALNLIKCDIENSNCNIKLKKELFGYLSYQYLILLKDIGSEKDIQKQKEAYLQIQNLNYLINYSIGIKGNICKLIIKILGVGAFSKISCLLKK